MRQLFQTDVKRLFTNDDKLYIVLKDKIIFLNMPVLTTDSPFIMSQLYFYPNDEHLITEKVIGHANVYEKTNSSLTINVKNPVFDNQLTYELYFDRKFSNISYNHVYLLSFEVVPGFRVMQTPADFKDKLTENIATVKLNVTSTRAPGKPSKHFNSSITDRTTIDLILTKQFSFEIRTDPKNEKETAIKYTYCSNPYEDKLRNCFEVLEQIEENRYKLSAAHFGPFTNLDKEFYIFRFVYLDLKNNLVFVNKLFKFDKKKKVIIFHEGYESYLSFGEFFSCPTSLFTDAEQSIKGIYYNKKAKRFYIFVRRYFVDTSTDLVLDNFKFQDKYLYNKAKPLKFEQETYNVEFELFDTKYIKNLKYDSFLTTHKDNSFEVDDKNLAKNQQNFKKVNNLLGFCKHQTLQINFNIYCFEEKEYFLFTNYSEMNSDKGLKKGPKFKIVDLFEDHPQLNYSSYDELKFIFNYLDHNFVFMTKSQIYVFDYDQFKIDKQESKLNVELYLGEQILVKKNHLFKEMDFVKLSRSLEEKDTSWPNIFLITLVALLLIVIVGQLYLNEVKNVKIKELPNLIKSKTTKFKKFQFPIPTPKKSLPDVKLTKSENIELKECKKPSEESIDKKESEELKSKEDTQSKSPPDDKLTKLKSNELIVFKKPSKEAVDKKALAFSRSAQIKKSKEELKSKETQSPPDDKLILSEVTSIELKDDKKPSKEAVNKKASKEIERLKSINQSKSNSSLSLKISRIKSSKETTKLKSLTKIKYLETNM